MDWPTRFLRSRIVWLAIRVHYWRRRRWLPPATLSGEPAWWNEFEQAFWAYARSLAPPDDRGTPTNHPPSSQPDA